MDFNGENNKTRRLHQKELLMNFLPLNIFPRVYL